MIIWLKRIVLLVGFFSLVLFGVLYLWGVTLLEASLQSRLESRGQQLEIESVRFTLTGVEARIERFEREDLLVEGGTIRCPWSQLWAMDEGFAGSVIVEKLVLRIKENDAPTPDAVALTMEARVADFAEQVSHLALSVVELRVDDLQLELEATGQTFSYEAECSFLRGASGEVYLKAEAQDTTTHWDIRVKVLEGGESLALDFAISASDWERFQPVYLASLAARLDEAKAELYINPLGEARGFLDVSGYARWEATAPEDLSLTLLADFGASEYYFLGGELLLQNASIGLAQDGAGHRRAYGKGAIESFRSGSFARTGGDWAVRVDESKVAGELRVGDDVSLSVGHDNWSELIEGAGAGQVHLDASAVDAQTLRALGVSALPEDIDMSLTLSVEGAGTLKEWRVESASVELVIKAEQVSLASSGLFAKGLDARANVHFAEAKIEQGSITGHVGSLGLPGFAMENFTLAAELDQAGKLAVEPIKADLMGGRFQMDAIELDTHSLEEVPMRIRLDSIKLSQLAQAVPQFNGDISGKVSGYLVGTLRDGQPILTDGRIEVDPGSDARLSYDVNGLLTRGMPKDSAAYKQYRMAEIAFQDLALRRFRVDVFPEGYPHRPFRLELFGESTQDGTVVPVDFNLNVNVDNTTGLLDLLRMIQRGELDF